MHPAKIVFIGGGHMAKSLISGMIADGYRAKQLWVVDKHPEKRSFFEQTYHINTTGDVQKAVALADLLILAVKPQAAAALAHDIGALVKQKAPIVVSVMAGIRQVHLAEWFGPKTPIIRAMPNTPALIQTSATTLLANAQASSAQKSLVERLLRSVGITVWLTQEADMDLTTAIAGSGPAYFFYFMQLLQQHAEALGLSPAIAKLLVLQTAFGATKLALESDESFEQLCQQVTSKGGTTEAGLEKFQALDLSRMIQEAVTAAQNRSIALGKCFGQGQCTLSGDVPH